MTSITDAIKIRSRSPSPVSLPDPKKIRLSKEEEEDSDTEVEDSDDEVSFMDVFMDEDMLEDGVDYLVRIISCLEKPCFTELVNYKEEKLPFLHAMVCIGNLELIQAAKKRIAELGLKDQVNELLLKTTDFRGKNLLHEILGGVPDRDDDAGAEAIFDELAEEYLPLFKKLNKMKDERGETPIDKLEECYDDFVERVKMALQEEEEEEEESDDDDE